MSNLSLNVFLSGKIAQDLGVKPEQVTSQFIHEMRKKMYADTDLRHGIPPEPPTFEQCKEE